MTKKLLFAAAIACFAILCFWVRAWGIKKSHDMACLDIAMEVARMIREEKDVSESSVHNQIAILIRASVVDGGELDSSGQPTDLNGNLFQIQLSPERVTVSTQYSFFQSATSRADASISGNILPSISTKPE